MMFELAWCYSITRRFVSGGVSYALWVVIAGAALWAFAPNHKLAAAINDPVLNFQTLGLPRVDHQPNLSEVALGAQLFFDRRLSVDATVACSTCHVPQQGFTQNHPAIPTGVFGRVGRRNAPALFNLMFAHQLFADGRETSLLQQVWSPILQPHEMGHASRQKFIAHVRQISGYPEQFAAVYAQGLSLQTFATALTAYQQILLAGNSAFDRWYYGGQIKAVPEEVKQGFTLFVDIGCSRCHQLGEGYTFFSDGQFHNTGVALRQFERTGVQDLGREEVTGVIADRRKFRTPSLRNVVLTAPYMHDGSMATLEDVLRFYDAGGGEDPNQDPGLKPLDLSQKEHHMLLAFLNALTSANAKDLAIESKRLRELQIR